MKQELLAPAGDIEAGYAALYYGADAAKCIKSTLRVISVGNDNGGDKDRCFILSTDGLSPYIEDMQNGAFFKKVS